MRETLSSSPSHLRPQLKYLTGLRFFAALCIFILHASDHGLIPNDIVHIFDLSKAVSFFFVLSGFVLSYAYHLRIFSLIKFYLSRLSRIWPITFSSLLFTLLFLPQYLYLPSSSDLNNAGLILVSNILCFQSMIPIPSFHFGYNAVAWSISCELFFYLFFPFLIRLSFPKLLSLFSCISIFCCIISYWLSTSSFPFFSHSSLDSLSIHGFIYINPIFRLPEFLIGILTYHASCLISKHRAFLSRNIYFANLIANKLFLSDILCIFCILVCFLHAFPFAGVPVSLQITLNQLKSGIGFSLFIIILRHTKSFLSILLSSSPLVFLGQISLGLYLFHQPFMIRFSNLGGLYFGDLNLFPPNVFFVFAYSISTSIFFHYFIERPCRRFFLAFH